MADNCKYFTESLCRSCSHFEDLNNDMTHLGKEALEHIGRVKVDSLRNLFTPLLSSHRQTPEWKSLVQPKSIRASRAKAKMLVSGTNESPIIGLTDSEFKGIELLNCPIHKPILNRILQSVKEKITSFKLSPYSIEERKGELKALILVTNSNQTECLLRFVVRSSESVERIKKASKELLAEFKEIKVITANIQPLPAAILEGAEEIFLTEEKRIEERYQACSIFIGAQSFVQVSPEVACALYGFAASVLARAPHQTLYDLYCGTGAFSFACARFVKVAYGVEQTAQSIEAANAMKEKVCANNLTFYVEDATKWFLNQTLENQSVVLVNPPRRGLSKELSDAITKKLPSTILYSSCNPESLLRDLETFLGQYVITTIAPFDMFPMTKHLEVMVVLQRR